MSGFFTPYALGQTATPSCEAVSPMTPTRLLRRLSLDLRGHPPSMQEIEETLSAGQVPEATISTWLESPDFRSVMRRHHEALLWPNLDQVELVPQNFLLFPYPRGDDVVYVSPLRSVFIRAAGGANLVEPCLDEPAEFNAQGELILKPLLVGTATVAWLDGWIETQPYWAPDTTIKVCALEAITAPTAAVCPEDPDKYPFIEPACQSFKSVADNLGLPFRGTQVDCGGPLATFSPFCGCGPQLERCHTLETFIQLRQAFNDQALRIIDRMLQENAPYTDILLNLNIEVNGPIAHYFRHQSRLDFNLFADPDPSAPMGEVDLSFTDTNWVSIKRSGRHAGLLTSPAYLMRHAAWRQRAHRYYAAFECSAFTPSGPLPSPFDPCSQREDLTQRCGCSDCHTVLEPLAAHWARFAEYGFMALNEDRFPIQGASVCSPPFESIEQLFLCDRLYKLNPVGEEEAYRGFLNGYVFRTADEQLSIEEGPRRRVQQSIASRRIAECTVERMWMQFMHRSPTPDERADVLPDMIDAFTTNNYDIRSLIKTIVSQPAYGRAP